MIESMSKACRGCGACADACQVGAITLREDELGFLRADVAQAACAHCGACERVCATREEPTGERWPKPKVYGAWAKQGAEIGNSGGLFLAFAKRWIRQGGAVVAPAYSDAFELRHCVATCEEELYPQAWSKFAQSNPQGAYLAIRKKLDQQTQVLFVGAPCQVKGLYAYLGGEHPCLTTVQFPCMGTPPQRFLRAYIQWLSGQPLEQVEEFLAEVSLSSEDAGRSMVCRMKDGTVVSETAAQSAFVRLWNEGLVISEHCLDCRDNLLPARADLIWGNFWYLGAAWPCRKKKLAPGRKVSMLLVNSPQGERAVEMMRDDLVLFRRSLREAKTGHFMFQATWRRHLMMRRFCGAESREKFQRRMMEQPLEVFFEEHRAKRTGETKGAFDLAKMMPAWIKGWIWRMIYHAQMMVNRLSGE